MTNDTRTDRQVLDALAAQLGATVTTNGRHVGFAVGGIEVDTLMTNDIAQMARVKVNGDSKIMRDGADFRTWAPRVVRKALRSS